MEIFLYISKVCGIRNETSVGKTYLSFLHLLRYFVIVYQLK
jgi:hypothetical protein